MDISIQPGRVTRAIACVVLCLILASAAGHVAKYGFGHGGLLGIIPLFDVMQEANVPTWFSSALLLLCALCLAVIARLKWSTRDPFVRHWAALAVVFLLLSLDETAQLHDLLDERMQDAFHLHGPFYYAWVIPAAGFVVVMAVAYFRLLVSLPPRIRRLFVLAATAYVGGALGLEMVAAVYDDTHGFDNAITATLATVEETLEMVGVVTFLHALMTYVAGPAGALRLQFATASDLTSTSPPAD